ncbi:MAG: DUF5947 family protein, partial [Bdellovibrionia bacterium]
RDTIEKAVYEAVPDIIAIEVEGMITPEKNIHEHDRIREHSLVDDAEKEKCELCSQAIPGTHHHLLDVSSQKILCSCIGCSILFNQSTSESYRRIPTEIRALDDFLLSDDQWDRLSVPVKLAFFYHSSALNKVRAYYPSPAGATESLLSLDAWNALVIDNPILAEFETDVETLLVDRTKSPARYFRVPLDESFKLVGLFRKHWTGFSGGDKVWTEVGQFFDELTAKAVS